jgi:predicted nucleic acid-binding protein
MKGSIYLFDASSIVKAIKTTKIVPLGNQCVQQLTIYEVLNALWKENILFHMISKNEVLKLTKNFLKLLDEMNILDPSECIEDIMRIALSERLTVYDASYTALSKKHRLTFVTEDRKLAEAAKHCVNTSSYENII